VQRPFHRVEQVSDVVEPDPRPKRAQVSGLNHERRLGIPPPGSGRESPSKGVVHDGAERFTGTAGLRLEPTGDVFVEGQGRSHIVMLRW